MNNKIIMIHSRFLTSFTFDKSYCFLGLTLFCRWLGFILASMGAFIIFFASIFAVVQRDAITAGLAGLSVSFAMQVS